MKSLLFLVFLGIASAVPYGSFSQPQTFPAPQASYAPAAPVAPQSAYTPAPVVNQPEPQISVQHISRPRPVQQQEPQQYGAPAAPQYGNAPEPQISVQHISRPRPVQQVATPAPYAAPAPQSSYAPAPAPQSTYAAPEPQISVQHISRPRPVVTVAPVVQSAYPAPAPQSAYAPAPQMVAPQSAYGAAPQMAAPQSAYGAAPAPQSAPSAPVIPIITYNAVSDDDGNYKFKYESADGTVREERGQQNGDEHVKDGSVKYNSPDGEMIQLTFTADKDGFRPQGNHLPTPPPVPQAILDAIALLRATAAHHVEIAQQHQAMALAAPVNNGYQTAPVQQTFPVNNGYQAAPVPQAFPVNNGYQAVPVPQAFPVNNGYQAAPVPQALPVMNNGY